MFVREKKTEAGAQQRPARALSGSDDLLSLFALSSVYDSVVRLYLPPPTTNTNQQPSTSSPSAKGKEAAGEKQHRLKPEKRFHKWIEDVSG
jgi:hypothetical protein